MKIQRLRLAKYAVVCVLAAISLFPIFILVATSLKTRVQAFSIPPVWIFVPTLQNYVCVLFRENFLRFFFNSIVVALFSTLFSVIMGGLAGYALVRFRFMGKGVVSVSTLLLRMIPPVVLVIPVFVLWSRFGIINSRIGLIIAYVALNLPFTIWLLHSFIAEIPVELEEAAVLDGCGELGIFFRIIMPLITPGVAAASIFTFRIAWNEFILSLVLTNRLTRTLPVAVSLYLTDYGIEWGKITAIGTFIALPAFVFTFVAARKLIRGLTAGAVKY